MTRSTRVLMLVENNTYPSDFRVRREAHTLRDAGYHVSVIAPRGDGQSWKECDDEIAIFRFPTPPEGRGLIGYAVEFGCATFAMFLLTTWIALRHGIDVIHAANPPDTLCSIAAIFKLFGKRYVFDQHDLSPELYLSRFAQPHANFVYKALRFFERWSYTIADVVIVTNESYKEVATERGKKNPDKVFIVRNGPPLSYRLVEPDPDFARTAKHLIGYIGTIGPQDGVDYWIRAIRELVFTLGRRDFQAIIIGNGDALQAVQSLAKELEIEPYLKFTGRLDEFDARKCLSAMDVCVQPDPLNSLNDKSTMNKLMEYMALGKPVVAFDLVETRFSAGDAAVYVKPNDVCEFAHQVNWLLENPDEGKKMGEIGHSLVANELAWEYSAPELLRAYNEGLKLCPR